MIYFIQFTFVRCIAYPQTVHLTIHDREIIVNIVFMAKKIAPNCLRFIKLRGKNLEKISYSDKQKSRILFY